MSSSTGVRRASSRSTAGSVRVCASDRHERHEPGGVVRRVLAHPEVVELGDPLLGRGVADHDHAPGLAVTAVGREARVVEDLVQHVVGQRVVGELPRRRRRAHGLAAAPCREPRARGVTGPRHAQGRQMRLTSETSRPSSPTSVMATRTNVSSTSPGATSAVAATGPDRTRLRKRMSRSTDGELPGEQRALGRDLREQRLHAALDRPAGAVADPRMRRPSRSCTRPGHAVAADRRTTARRSRRPAARRTPPRAPSAGS